jgi:hypothetical protein
MGIYLKKILTSCNNAKTDEIYHHRPVQIDHKFHWRRFCFSDVFLLLEFIN